MAPNFLNFVNQANIFSGGAFFNSAGQSVTIPQNLVSAAAGASQGLSNSGITISSGGSGYIGNPVVQITGGGGTGATAIATIGGGAVTGITITNPGTGYTSQPTINLIQGGGTGAAVTATPTPNAADGGVTKTGSGTLTLSGSNTYTGGTFVNGGTLAIANASALGTGTATLANQTTLALSAVPQLVPFTNFVVNTGTPGASAFTPVLSNGGNGTSALLSSNIGTETTAIWSPGKYTINDSTGFTASFTYTHGTLGNALSSADGVAFVIQNTSQFSIGAPGNALAYAGVNTSSQGISTSVAVGVDVYMDQLEVGVNGFWNTSSISTYNTSIPFISQFPAAQVTVSYAYNASAGTGYLTETITSLSNNSSYTLPAVAIDIPAILGGTAGGSGTGYIGFTGATGGLSDAQAVSNFAFNNTAHTFTTSAIGISNPVAVPSGSATLQLAPTAVYSSGAVGPITIGSGATLAVSIGSSPAAGVVRGVLTTPSVIFSNASSGTLDVAGNALDITSQSIAAVTAIVASAYQNGTWAGAGITSSSAAGNTAHLTALGVIQNNQSGTAIYTGSNTFDAITPGTGDVLVKYTFYGDTNLDGKVDGSDYSRIDNGALSNGTLTGWYNGDFNYDGVINGSDYTLIDNAFNTQGASLAASISPANPTAQIAGTSAVPEPASLGLIVMSIQPIRC